jgi:hypothetical protein
MRGSACEERVSIGSDCGLVRLSCGDFWELRESVQALLLDVAQLSNTATRELIQKRISLLRNIATREPDEPTVGADRHAFLAS